MNKIEEENKELKEQLSFLEKINFKYINKGGAVKMISWGKDYKKWALEKQLEYAEALASAMNDACDIIQKERDALIIERDLLQESLATTEEAISNQRNNNINSITKANATQQELIKTIRRLENENLAYQKRIEELSVDLLLANQA